MKDDLDPPDVVPTEPTLKAAMQAAHLAKMRSDRAHRSFRKADRAHLIRIYMASGDRCPLCCRLYDSEGHNSCRTVARLDHGKRYKRGNVGICCQRCNRAMSGQVWQSPLWLLRFGEWAYWIEEGHWPAISWHGRFLWMMRHWTFGDPEPPTLWSHLENPAAEAKCEGP